MEYSYNKCLYGNGRPTEDTEFLRLKIKFQCKKTVSICVHPCLKKTAENRKRSNLCEVTPPF